jgi:hypothetical protein
MNVLAATSECPVGLQIQSPILSTVFPLMSAFDLATVRKAVAEFTSRRPEKFQDLLPAKDVISELRSKRASYRAIAELLTQHCLPTSKTAIAVFCHKILGEIVRPHKRPARRQSVATVVKTTDQGASPQQTGIEVPSAEASDGSNGEDAQQTRTRGPRIAQVRMSKPENT